MKKVGLDPKDIKYLIVSHAHQDHIGGAEMIQKRYGPRLVMSGARLGPGREGAETLHNHGAEARHRGGPTA